MDNRKFPEGQRARQPRITKRSDGLVIRVIRVIRGCDFPSENAERNQPRITRMARMNKAQSV